VLDGASREDVAQIGGIDRQMLQDGVGSTSRELPPKLNAIRLGEFF
jgi:hypothetical protein